MSRNSEKIVIETPEQVELRFEPAEVGARCIAYIIDRLIRLFAVLILILMFSLGLFLVGETASLMSRLESAFKSAGGWLIAFGIIVYWLISVCYFMIFEYVWSGRTPGKYTQRIRVIRADGRPLTFVDAAIRNILRLVDILGEIYPIGLIVMIVDSRNRRLGDFTAGTLVIRDTREYEEIIPETAVRTADDNPLIRDTARSMTIEEYRLIRKFLLRRDDLNEEHRRRLAQSIADRIFGKGGRSVSSIRNPEAALETAAALYRQKTRIL